MNNIHPIHCRCGYSLCARRRRAWPRRALFAVGAFAVAICVAIVALGLCLATIFGGRR